MSERLEQVKSLLRGIRREDEGYQQLRTLLEQQRLCMIKRECETLTTVNESINQHYELLSRSTQERRDTLLNLGLTADGAGIQQIFSWLPPLQKQAAQAWWKQLERQAESCKAYNEKNGVLLNHQYEFVQDFLGTGQDYIYQRQI